MKAPILTPREKEVLDLLKGGMADKEIAEVLKISVRGVQYHVRRLLKKYHVNTRRAFMLDVTKRDT